MDMAKVRFLLKEPQHTIEDKKKQPSLVLFVYRINAAKKVVYSIREYISPMDWDFEQQLPKSIRGRSDLSELRIKLNNIESHVLSFFRSMENQDITLTTELITSELDLFFKRSMKDKVPVSVLSYAKNVYVRGKNDDNVKLITSAATRFNKFRPGITFDKINMNLIEEYNNYLLKTGFKNNTIVNYINSLYTIVQHAAKTSGIKLQPDALEGIGVKRIPREHVKRAVLTVEELSKLYHLDVQDPLKRHVRDVFIISSFTGIRSKDAKLSENIHFDGRFFAKRTSKTGKYVKIPLHPFVKELIERYNGFSYPDISDHNYNEIVRSLVKEAGIDQQFSFSITIGGVKTDLVKYKYECISSHTARRSFATNIHKAGIPPAVAMVFTGHKKLQQYMDYIMLYEDEIAEEYENHSFFTSISDK